MDRPRRVRFSEKVASVALAAALAVTPAALLADRSEQDYRAMGAAAFETRPTGNR
ncbi:hypothetical protein [Saccharomonospora sp. CUA-673]|uniref:hypothetical protein n=1 Tax=Saccharomonospora sp. CUA-673 TaxID=1904969 RepID=UPI001300DF92|nr:hypothetical protein [Saccharomonospora sp. CUA-673]